MIVGIDLIWIKVKKVGGLESYIRNLLEGFSQYSKDIQFVLFLAKDNIQSFRCYAKNKKFKFVQCNIESTKILQRVLWQNLYFNRMAKKYNLDLVFVPMHVKPIFNAGLKYVTVIHDLQPLHYPEYFSYFKILWLKFIWRRTFATSHKLIAISDFVKNDVIQNYHIATNKILTIPNPIVIQNGSYNFDDLNGRYNIEKDKYFYTISSMLKHKNLVTLLKVIKKLKKSSATPYKLVISGVGGDLNSHILRYIEENSLQEYIILTGFVSDEERNCLYRNCSIFLFSSIFEGFGMPVVEAPLLGADVLCVSQEALVEITNNELLYINDPYSVNEWIEKIFFVLEHGNKVSPSTLERYALKLVSERYLEVFKDI